MFSVPPAWITPSCALSEIVQFQFVALLLPSLSTLIPSLLVSGDQAVLQRRRGFVKIEAGVGIRLQSRVRHCHGRSGIAGVDVDALQCVARDGAVQDRQR